MSTKTDLAQYRLSIQYVRRRDDGKIEYIDSGWQLVKYPGHPEGFEPVDVYVGADPTLQGSKQITGTILKDGPTYGFSDVTGGDVNLPWTLN